MFYSTFVELMGNEEGLGGDMAFVGRAVSDDETRFFMQYILVEPVEEGSPHLRAVATDGRRLHMVELPENVGLDAGYWRVLKSAPRAVWLAKLKDPYFSFPNYRRVIPAGAPDFTFDIDGRCFVTSSQGLNIIELAKFLRSFPEPTALNFSYLKDLGAGRIWTVEYRKAESERDKKAVVFRSGNRFAVVMPMMLD